MLSTYLNDRAHSRRRQKDQVREPPRGPASLRSLGRGVVSLAVGTTMGCGAPAPSDQPEARAIAPLAAPEPSWMPAAPLPLPTSPPRARPAEATPPASRSLGGTGRGSLERAALLPQNSDALRPTPGAIRSGATFGHHTLVAALARAATRIRAEHPTSTLFVADISRERGGSFPPHASHTSGRDVDLPFFVEDGFGVDRDAGAMTRVLPTGTVAGSDVRFDLERNWRLVELLLRDPAIQVQWIFVAAEIETMLLEFAQRTGQDPTTIERAASVMLQPRDSSPHNDHFHLRVYCSRDDRLQGCVDSPPFHPWVDDHSEALGLWLEGVAPFFSLPGTDEYRWALEEVARNYVREALPILEAMPIPTDVGDANLRDEVINHLKRGDRADNRWRDLEPTDTPP